MTEKPFNNLGIKEMQWAPIFCRKLVSSKKGLVEIFSWPTHIIIRASVKRIFDHVNFQQKIIAGLSRFLLKRICFCVLPDPDRGNLALQPDQVKSWLVRWLKNRKLRRQKTDYNSFFLHLNIFKYSKMGKHKKSNSRKRNQNEFVMVETIEDAVRNSLTHKLSW